MTVGPQYHGDVNGKAWTSDGGGSAPGPLRLLTPRATAGSRPMGT